MDYEMYEKECERIRGENEKLLSGFAAWLSAQGLSQKTINKHILRVDFYINVFLLYEEALEAKDGIWEIGLFLGYWFIRKAMWSSKASIKANAASLKKFYKYMSEINEISVGELAAFKEEIKEDMPEWLATMDRYDDPSIEDMEEVWGI